MGKSRHIEFDDWNDKKVFTSRKHLAKIAKQERKNRHKREISDEDIQYTHPKGKRPT